MSGLGFDLVLVLVLGLGLGFDLGFECYPNYQSKQRWPYVPMSLILTLTLTLTLTLSVTPTLLAICSPRCGPERSLHPRAYS